MSTTRKTFDVGRDSKTGHFIPVKEAERRPNTTTVERIPSRGAATPRTSRRGRSNLPVVGGRANHIGRPSCI